MAYMGLHRSYFIDLLQGSFKNMMMRDGRNAEEMLWRGGEVLPLKLAHLPLKFIPFSAGVFRSLR